MDTKIKLSTLWIVVMFTMVFADILTFMIPGALKEIVQGKTEVIITQPLLLVFAISLEIPILMIWLSRQLRYTVNRWANIIAAIITIFFVIGGGAWYLHYLFFATVEVICMLLITWYAWKWKLS